MKKEVNETVVMQAVDWAYDKAITGVPGFETAQELGNDYLNQSGTLIERVNSLINWQIGKAGATGFITNVGGVLTMPVAIPVNLGTVLYIQIRMIAAIAHMGGFDLKNDKVKALVYFCLVGNPIKEGIKGVGVSFGTKLSTSLLKKLSGQIIKDINKKVGFRLITKFGEKGVINLVKFIPLIGGAISGSLDAASTNTIGTSARDTFIGKK